MKAKDFLYWCLDYGVSTECGVDHIEIEDETIFCETKAEFIERFFGAKPLKDIPAGEYVYVWSNVIDDKSDTCKEFILKNSETRLCLDDCYIYLLRLDD